MQLKRLTGDFSVCKVADFTEINLEAEYCFTGRTDEENSVVCLTKDVPQNVTAREDGWRAFRIDGVLDFSLIGILAEIATLLAEEKIGIFAVSTFNTDYIFVKRENERKAMDKLSRCGHQIQSGDGCDDAFSI